MTTHEDDDIDFDEGDDGKSFLDYFLKDFKPDLKSILGNSDGFTPSVLEPMEFNLSKSTAQQALEVAKDSATQAEKQTALLDALAALGAEQAQTLAAMSKASRDQAQTLAAMRQLSEELASERRRSAAREDRQQAFNKGMTILASILAGAAVVVPFGILWIEQALKLVTP